MALETEVAARSLKVIAAVIHLLAVIVAATDEMRHADRRRVTMTPILNKEGAVAGTAAAVGVMTVARHHQHEGDTPRTVRRYVAAATERAIAAEVTTIRGATTTVTATITGRLDARPIDPATTHVVKPVNDAVSSTGIEVVAHAVADVPRMTPPVRCHPVRC